MSTTYFSPATFKFLRALARNNNRTWFTANKASYERHVREPYLQLIADLQAPLAKISPHYRADPRRQGGSLFRIHRDVRYGNDKTPYKTWAGARLFHERSRDIEAPSYYIHLQPGDCFAGGGVWHPQPATLKRIRDFLVDNPEAWKRATRSRSFAARYRFWGESLTRPPRGYPADHPLIDDLKRKNHAAGCAMDDALMCSAELRPVLVEHFRRLAPLLDYLCAALDLSF